jgi:RNA methyltransferase, RsmE family
MDLKRFFPFSVKGGEIILKGEEFYHAVKVTRHKVGYKFIAPFEGIDYTAEITEIGKDFLNAKIVGQERNETEARAKIVLFQAACKELGFIAEKAVELGCSELVPYYSARTNIKEVNTERLNKISLSASKQCGRALVMKIGEPLNFSESLRYGKNFEEKIFCYEGCKAPLITESVSPSASSASLFIGPEGGFSPEEVEAAENSGYKIVSLGKRILRAETAAVAGLTLILTSLKEI